MGVSPDVFMLMNHFIESNKVFATILSSMASLPVAPRSMIVSNLDHTMVDHANADNVSLLRFNALWAANYYHDSILVFSTGRSLTLYKELRSHKPMKA